MGKLRLSLKSYCWFGVQQLGKVGTKEGMRELALRHLQACYYTYRDCVSELGSWRKHAAWGGGATSSRKSQGSQESLNLVEPSRGGRRIS